MATRHPSANSLEDIRGGMLLGFLVCWLNLWVGKNFGSLLSCITYLEKDSEDRKLKGLYEESLKALEEKLEEKLH